MSQTSEQTRATNIDIDIQQREVRIDWADGFQSRYSFDLLRKECPCAMCEQQRANADPLRVFKADQAVVRADLRHEMPAGMVGNYALQFYWADGHQTGIYTFEFLRYLSAKK